MAAKSACAAVRRAPLRLFISARGLGQFPPAVCCAYNCSMSGHRAGSSDRCDATRGNAPREKAIGRLGRQKRLRDALVCNPWHRRGVDNCDLGEVKPSLPLAFACASPHTPGRLPRVSVFAVERRTPYAFFDEFCILEAPGVQYPSLSPVFLNGGDPTSCAAPLRLLANTVEMPVHGQGVC